MSTKVTVEQEREICQIRTMNGVVLPGYTVSVRVEFERGHHERARDLLTEAYGAALAELEEFDDDGTEPEVRAVQAGGGGDA